MWIIKVMVFHPMFWSMNSTCWCFFDGIRTGKCRKRSWIFTLIKHVLAEVFFRKEESKKNVWPGAYQIKVRVCIMNHLYPIAMHCPITICFQMPELVNFSEKLTKVNVPKQLSFDWHWHIFVIKQMIATSLL